MVLKLYSNDHLVEVQGEQLVTWIWLFLLSSCLKTN